MCDVTWNEEPNNTCERRRHGDKQHIVRRCVSGNRDTPFCYGNEENSHHACMNGYLTTANQSEIRRAYLVSVCGGANGHHAEIVLAQIYKHGGL